MKIIIDWLRDRLAVVKSAYYDLKLGIRVGNKCLPDPEQDSSRHGDMRGYQSLNYGTLKRIMRSLELGCGDVFVDLGCGKGRVIAYAATHRLKKVVGLELDKDHFSAALRNCSNLKAKRTPVEVIQGDAAAFDLSEATVVFLFNPFGERTLEAVLRNLKASFDEKPRPLRIAYHTPRHQELLDSQEWLIRQAQSPDGSWVIWRSRM